MDQFASYQQFFSPQEAESIITLLKEHGIPYTLTKTRGQLDAIITGVNYNDQYDLRIPQHEFTRVTDLLIANTKVNLDELDKDYYLLSFSREELENIINNPDEWSSNDYVIAVELLKSQGENVSREQLEELREKKIETLASSQKKVPGFWLVVAYALPLWSAVRIWTPFPKRAWLDNAIISVLATFSNYLMVYGGVIGVFVGLSLWKFKKLLPDGNSVYRFLPADRLHGNIIFYLGIIAVISLALAFFYTSITGEYSGYLLFD